jgi:ADP-heptose:LPS heptosyltransferase
MKKILYTIPHWLWDFISHLWVINSLSEHYWTKIDILTSNNDIKILKQYNKNIWDIIFIDIKYTYIWYILYFILYFMKDIFKINKKKYNVIISWNLNLVRKLLFKYIKSENKVFLWLKEHNITEEYKILNKLNIKYSKNIFLNNIGKIKHINNKYILKYFVKDKKTIVINMFCNNSDFFNFKSPRDWNKWRDLIDILKLKYNIVLVGQSKWNYLKLDWVIDMINKTNMDELLYIIDMSDLVISIDSFIFHLTYALNKNILWLFWPVNPIERLPPIYMNSSNIRTIYIQKDCSPCMNDANIFCKNKNNLNICMNSISVKEVLKEINNFNY